MQLSIGSANVRWSQRVGGGAIDLDTVLEELDADVVCLQELWQLAAGPDTLAPARARGYAVAECRLSTAALPATRGFAVDPERGEGSWGLAVLSRLPLRACPPIPLGGIRSDPAGERVAQVVAVELPGHGWRMVVCVHPTWRPPGSLLQLRRLRRGLVAMPEPPLAVAGDFNTFGACSRASLRGLRAVVRSPTWPASRPLFGLDEIFVGNRAEPVGHAVCADVGSDHRPIRALVDVK